MKTKTPFVEEANSKDSGTVYPSGQSYIDFFFFFFIYWGGKEQTPAFMFFLPSRM